MDARRRTSSSSASSRTSRPVNKSTTSWILRERPPRAEAPSLSPIAAVAPSYAGELPGQLLERLVSDPLFQVMTADRSCWICPFTGRAVPAGGGRLAAARQYLEHSGVWRNLAPLSGERINVERWRHDISNRLASEPRLRLFSRQGRGWLNPYSGDLEPSVLLEDGALTPHTITAMAEVLSICPPALRGVMLPQEDILRRYAQMQGADSASDDHTDTSEVVRLVTDEIGTEEADKIAAHDDDEDQDGEREALPVDASYRPGTEDLIQARRVQARSMTELPSHPDIALGVHFAPRAGVSGDFYHASVIDGGKMLLVLGDVSGHGVQAALVVASALKTLRFVLRAESDPVAIVLACNDELRDDLLPGQFISLFLAVIDPNELTMTAVCAGHHPAVLTNLRREFPLRRVGRSGMALGLSDRETLTRMLRPVIVDLELGDVLVQTTDGLLEAVDSQDREWGEARWMGSVLAHSDGKTPQDIADGVVHDCRSFSGLPVDDDLTVLVARLTPDESI